MCPQGDDILEEETDRKNYILQDYSGRILKRIMRQRTDCQEAFLCWGVSGKDSPEFSPIKFVAKIEKNREISQHKSK